MSAWPPSVRAAEDDFAIDDTPIARDNQHPEWFSETFLDLREDLASAKGKGKIGLLVYFGQKHCAYCEALLEINFEREQDIVNYTQAHFDVVALDIWGDRDVTLFDGSVISEKQWAEAEDTNFTPSLIFYTQDGIEALRLRGYYPPYKFRGALKYVVEGYYQNESLSEYMARATPPPKFDLDDLNEQAFFDPPPHALDRSRFAAERPLVVFFERGTCHACDILHSDPLEDEQTQQWLEWFDAVQLDMWSDTKVLTPSGGHLTAKEWAAKLGIFYAPTLVFFDEFGKEVIRVDSVVSLYRLRGVLEFVASKGYISGDTYQRWRERQQNQL